MTVESIPWTGLPVYTEYLWKVTGDGMFFSPFYVEARTYDSARAKAQDILAGSATANYSGKRFYGTVDSHIKSIVPVEGFRVEGNYHDTRLVRVNDSTGKDMT